MRSEEGVIWYRILCNYNDCDYDGIGDYGYCSLHQRYKGLKGKHNKNGVINR